LTLLFDAVATNAEIKLVHGGRAGDRQERKFSSIPIPPVLSRALRHRETDEPVDGNRRVMTPTSITKTAAALADPTRLRLLLLLHEVGLPVGKLAEALSVVPSVASFHVTKLEAVGLVVTQRRGRRTLVRRRHDRWRQVMLAFG